MKKLAILQPYVPAYRVPFFEALLGTLEQDGILCDVIAGRPSGDQALRGDSVDAPWITTVETSAITIGRRTVLTDAGYGKCSEYDAVILGLVGTSLDSFRAAFLRRSSQRLGFWGHIDSYVTDRSAAEASIKRVLMARADHIFSYTEGGKARATSLGVPPEKVTVVQNSVNTSQLRTLKSEYSARGRDVLTAEFGLGQGPIVSYIGGLDESKRIDFLANALDELFALDPNIQVLIAGDGRQRHLLEKAEARGQARLLGFADVQLKAQMAAVSSALLNPGRIGLIAAESLAIGLPILTATTRYHAPEVEYLREGDSLYTSRDDAVSYAQLIQRTAKASHVNSSWWYPTIEEMAQRFTNGVHYLFEG